MSNHTLRLNQASYRVNGKQVIKPISLELAPGRITAILGPNGSGKSTLLKMLSGLITPDGGEALLAGKPLLQWHRKALARKLALLPQHSPVPLGMSVSELVACGRYPHAGPFGRMKSSDHQAINTALARVDMADFAKTRVDHLSGGEMQRVWLAMILAQETGILLLDEPTSWLDIAHQLQLLDIVRTLNREQNTTVAWVLHDLNQALQFSDDVVLMNHGDLLRKGRADRVLDTEVIADVFGVKTTRVQPEGYDHCLFLPSANSTTEHLLQPVLSVSDKEVA